MSVKHDKNAENNLIDELFGCISDSLLAAIFTEVGYETPLGLSLGRRLMSIKNADGSGDMRERIKSAAFSARQKSFFDEVTRFIDRAQLNDPQVYNKAGMHRTLWYRLRDDRNARTSKQNVLKIALILRLSYFELYYLVNLAGYSFLPNNDQSDWIIAQCVWRNEYDPMAIDGALAENGQKALFAEE